MKPPLDSQDYAALKTHDDEVIRQLRAMLTELHALVWGECPSLLREDSGGCARLDFDIINILAKLESET